MRRLPGTFRIPLLALLVFGTVSGPGEGHAKAGTTGPPDPASRTGPGMSTGAQGVTLAVAARRYQRGTITGRVVLPTGPPVNNRIRVTLSGPRVTSMTAYTDNKGRFAFAGVSDGIYTLEVTADSNLYEPVTQEVRLIYGAHPGLIISLKDKAGAAARSNANVISTAEVDQNVPDAARKEFEKGAQPGRRSVLGDFLLAHDTILKHGLLGGTLTSAWALLNLKDRAPKLEYGGQKKIGDRLLETLRLIPRGGSDLRITIFFDAQNYQHVRTEFRRIVQAQMGGAPELSAGQRETRYTLIEEFSGFAKEGRLTLPHSYKLALVVDAPSGSLSSEWVMDLGTFLFNEPFPPESFNMAVERRL